MVGDWTLKDTGSWCSSSLCQVSAVLHRCSPDSTERYSTTEETGGRWESRSGEAVSSFPQGSRAKCQVVSEWSVALWTEGEPVIFFQTGQILPRDLHWFVITADTIRDVHHQPCQFKWKHHNHHLLVCELLHWFYLWQKRLETRCEAFLEQRFVNAS